MKTVDSHLSEHLYPSISPPNYGYQVPVLGTHQGGPLSSTSPYNPEADYHLLMPVRDCKSRQHTGATACNGWLQYRLRQNILQVAGLGERSRRASRVALARSARFRKKLSSRGLRSLKNTTRTVGELVRERRYAPKALRATEMGLVVDLLRKWSFMPPGIS